MPLLGEQKDVPQPLQQPGCAQVEARDDFSEPVVAVLFGPEPARSPDGAAETLQTSAGTIETRAAMLPLHKMFRINRTLSAKSLASGGTLKSPYQTTLTRHHKHILPDNSLTAMAANCKLHDPFPLVLKHPNI